MPRMIGEGFLPESIQSQRNRLRNRLNDLREPIRSRREQLVPGPDLVGRAESTFRNLRDRVVSRTTIMQRIRERRANGEEQEEGETQSGESRNKPTVN